MPDYPPGPDISPRRNNPVLKTASLGIFCGLFLCLAACRRDDSQTAGATGPAGRLQGVYQPSGDSQLIRECVSNRIALLQDTPGDELREICSLFDHPENTGLWLDLEGWWKKGKDTVFVIGHILKVERRNKETICR